MWNNKISCNLRPPYQLYMTEDDVITTTYNIVNFSSYYLIFPLVYSSNLQKWKQKKTLNCRHLLHLFNHFTTVMNQKEQRHDSIIQTIMNNLVTITSDSYRLYSDNVQSLYLRGQDHIYQVLPYGVIIPNVKFTICYYNTKKNLCNCDQIDVLF